MNTDIDRVQYVHSVELGTADYNTVILTYFDQLMGVYGIARPHNYKVKIVSSDINMITLQLTFADKDSAKTILQLLYDLHGSVTIYGRRFVVEVFDVSETAVGLRFTEQ